MTEVADWKCGLLITDSLVPEVNIKYVLKNHIFKFIPRAKITQN